MPRPTQAGQDGSWSQRAAAEHVAPWGGSRQRVETIVRRLGLAEPLAAEDVVVLQAVLVCGGWLAGEPEQHLVVAIRATLTAREASPEEPLHTVVEAGTGTVEAGVTADRVQQIVDAALARGQAVLVFPVSAWREALDVEARAARAAAEQLVDLATAGRLPPDLVARLQAALGP